MALLGRVALAALGVLAYKNRDKLAAWMKNQADQTEAAGNGNMIDGLIDRVGAGSGLGDLLDRFRTAGSAGEVDSWIRQGPNRPIEPRHVEEAIDPDTLDALAAQTGLSRDELLRRIATELPGTVDEMTPEGRLPDDDRSDEPDLLDDVPSKASAPQAGKGTVS